MKWGAFPWLLLIGPGLLAGNLLVANADAFQRPPALKPAIRFWTRVFTEIDTQQGFIHDNRKLGIVYATLDFPGRITRRRRAHRVQQVKRHYRGILRTLAHGKRSGLSAEQSRVLKLWPRDVTDHELRAAAHRLRFQLGQADKFAAGLVRSGAWRTFIHQTLADMGLPQALAALPHVESSFNPAAYSHVGAAGMWQFTRSTGRRFMRIDHIVDERLDPFLSTEAAAQLLKHNYSVLDDWALAITAYNHGVAGMRRAKNTLGTDNIATIIDRYHSRTFGFASRNFYPAFLAAMDVDQHAERYFGPIAYDPAISSEAAKVPDFVTVDTLTSILDVDRATLKSHNRSLRPAVWNGDKYVPRGYGLHLPRPAVAVAHTLARISPQARYVRQRPDVLHRIRRGETLSTIAARYDVGIRQLMALNSLHSRHLIRAGQVLRLPRTQPAATVAAVSAARQAHASPAVLHDGSYRVRRGDTIWEIARRFHMAQDALIAENDLRDKGRIYAGQLLNVAQRAKPKVDTTTESGPAAGSEPQAQPPGEARSDSTEAADKSVTDMSDAEIAQVESAEPTSAAEAEALGPTLATGAHPAASADPTDYSVAANGTIEVHAAETLGHYAEWLDLRARQLRRVNRMRYGTPVVIGDRLKLDLSEVTPAAFEKRRRAYHEKLQTNFFSHHRIAGTQTHVMHRGESVWRLTRRRYDVPVWLLRQYNPDLDLHDVRPGRQVVFPRLETKEDGDTTVPTARTQAS